MWRTSDVCAVITAHLVNIHGSDTLACVDGGREIKIPVYSCTLSPSVKAHGRNAIAIHAMMRQEMRINIISLNFHNIDSITN